MTERVLRRRLKANDRMIGLPEAANEVMPARHGQGQALSGRNRDKSGLRRSPRTQAFFSRPQNFSVLRVQAFSDAKLVALTLARSGRGLGLCSC